MHIELIQSDLTKAINKVQKAISSRTTMPILKCILLIAKEGKLTLVGNNMQIGIETNINAVILEEGTIAIDSKLFGELIRNIQSETISITTNKEMIVNIKSDNLDVEIKGFSHIDFPLIPIVKEENKITILESTLAKIISETVFAVADTDYMQTINGLLIEIKDNQISMAASDSYRFVLAKEFYLNDININKRIIIHGSSIKEIRKLLDCDSNKKIEIILEKNHALFYIGNTKIVTRLLQGEYIKYDNLIPINFNTEIKFKKKDLLEALGITSVFADRTNNIVVLRIKNNNLEVFSNSEIGNISKNIVIEQIGMNLEIAFNIKYLTEGLKAIDEEEIIFSFVNGSRSPGVIKPNSNRSYQYLISPVMLSGIN